MPQPLKTNPDQLFVVRAISRAAIATDLNEVLAELCLPCLDHNDPRLTDSVCVSYAVSVGELWDTTDQHAIKQLVCETLTAMGLVPTLDDAV